jgi:hypothetical protein
MWAYVLEYGSAVRSTEHTISLWNILGHVLAFREVMDEPNPTT